MALHENMKSAKILEEVIDYLLEAGYKKIDSFMEITDKETKIKVVVHTNNVPLSEKFSDDLYCCRDIELEEYGWEITNDTGFTCNLDALGMLIDNFDISEDEFTCTIILHRLKR